MEFSLNLKKLREGKCLSQAALANKIEVSTGLIGMYEDSGVFSDCSVCIRWYNTLYNIYNVGTFSKKHVFIFLQLSPNKKAPVRDMS